MMPHEFEMLWGLSVDGPQAASEIAEMLNRPVSRLFKTDGPKVANQLRRLVKAGYVVGDGYSPQLYELTEEGRRYVDA